MSEEAALKRPKPGDVWTSGGRMYGVCAECASIVRVDKPLIGGWHFCVEGRRG